MSTSACRLGVLPLLEKDQNDFLLLCHKKQAQCKCICAEEKYYKLLDMYLMR